MEIEKSKYSMQDVNKWAESYKDVGSFAAVARQAGVSRDTVGRWLTKYKDLFGIVFLKDVKAEFEKQGLRKCTICNDTKKLVCFGKNNASRCKPCGWKISAEWRNNNRVRSNAISREYNARRSGRDHALAIINGQKRCIDCLMAYDISAFYNARRTKKDGTRAKVARCRKYFLARVSNRRVNDVGFKLATHLRTRTRQAIKNGQKKGLGC